MQKTHSPQTTEKSPAPQPRFRWLKRIGLLVAGLLVVGMVSQVVLDWRDGRNHPAPGELVQLSDGRSIHVQLSGMENDGPLVILEAGAGSFSSQWAWVQQEISEIAPVLSYDRAGLGWSDGPVGGRTSQAATSDLIEVLDELGLDGPYVFVGHSFGAVFSRMFASAYPEDVAGLVLVDPAHEKQFDRFPAMGDTTAANALRVMSRVGLFRLLRPFDAFGENMPAQAFAQWRSVAYTTRYADAQAAEASHLVDEVSPWFTAQDTDLGDTPLVILQAGEAEWPDPGMKGLQRELVAHSTNSRFEVVPEADHLSIVTDEEHAAVISAAITELIATAQASR
jgi:pimeloyl-ACP methyl ester carboxylesterase